MKEKLNQSVCFVYLQQITSVVRTLFRLDESTEIVNGRIAIDYDGDEGLPKWQTLFQSLLEHAKSQQIAFEKEGVLSVPVLVRALAKHYSEDKPDPDLARKKFLSVFERINFGHQMNWHALYWLASVIDDGHGLGKLVLTCLDDESGHSGLVISQDSHFISFAFR